MSDLIAKLSEDNFDDAITNSENMVLVDFWADWCGPCKSLAPIIEDIAEEFEGELKVAKVNADENPAISEKYAVRGLPTMILFKDGKECNRMVGLSNKSRIADFIEAQL